MAHLYLCPKIRTKQWLLGASAFECMRACILCDNLQFLPKSTASVNRSQAHLAKRKRIGWSIGFNSWSNWTLYGVIPRSLCKIRLNDVSEMFNCLEKRWIDVDGASLTWVYALFLAFNALVYRLGCQFLSQDNEHTELTVLLFFQNPCAIFAQHLQHYHDFHTYTQPYSFGIICQIRHEQSVTIHEISTSWKICWMADPIQAIVAKLHSLILVRVLKGFYVVFPSEKISTRFDLFHLRQVCSRICENVSFFSDEYTRYKQSKG